MGARLLHSRILHIENLVALGQKLQLVADEHNSLAAEIAADALSEYVAPDFGINSGQRVIEEIELFVGVECTGQLVVCGRKSKDEEQGVRGSQQVSGLSDAPQRAASGRR